MIEPEAGAAIMTPITPTARKTPGPWTGANWVPGKSVCLAETGRVHDRDKLPGLFARLPVPGEIFPCSSVGG